MEKGQAELILEMTAISGELPPGQAIRLCNTEHYKRKIITALKNDGLLNSFTKDGLKGYRLTSQAKKSLIAKNPERYTFYLTGITDTNRIRSEYSRRYRLHRISESFVTMHNAGASIFRDNKPDIFNSELSIPSPGQANIFKTSAYYDSREVKDLGEEAAKINNSRFVGVLLTNTDIYMVYNTGNAVMKWNYKSELRAKALISAYLCQQKLTALYAKKDIKAIVMGDNMEIAYELLTSGGKTKKNFFVMDATFDSFQYISNDSAGEMLLKILNDDNIRYSLDLTLKKDLLPVSRKFNIDNDAAGADGNPVLFAYNMDLPRIVRFSYGEKAVTEYLQCILFDAAAEKFIKAGVKKGSLIWLNGKLSLRTFTRKSDNSQDKVMNVQVFDWGYVPSGSKEKAEGEKAESGAKPTKPEKEFTHYDETSVGEDDELPF